MFKKADSGERIAKARALDASTFDRLMARVIRSSSGDCWPSRRSVNGDGYSRIKVRGKSLGAHRVMFSLFYPETNAEVVRHMCHRPNCVNPAHLRAGTQLENIQDRVLAGRSARLRGELNGRSKLSSADVIDIFSSSDSGASVARRLGISTVLACKIRRGEAWAHITTGKLS